jgi:hypothetical protein
MPTITCTFDMLQWGARMLGLYTKPEKKKREPEELPILGDAQRKVVGDKLKKLNSEDKKKVEQLTKDAKSKKEKEYILKGLATNHSVAELEAFAKKIRGKDEKWLKDNLSLTGSSEGKGVKQQWSHSCNATTVQAVKGQLDPIYALKLHEENKDITDADDSDGAKMNKKLAAEQKKMLESEYSGKDFGKHKGVAADRDEGAKGGGRWADDLLNDMSSVTGVKYKNKLIDDKDYKIADAMREIEKGAKAGHPVPIVIGGSVGDYAHYVLVTGVLKGPPVQWVIHDPWDGITVNRSVSDVKNGKINLAGHKRLTAIENPSAK